MKKLTFSLFILIGLIAQAQEVKTIKYPNGDSYEGQVNDQGKPHGKGKGIFLKSNTLYYGDFSNGLINGKGNIVQWNFKNGKADTTDRYTGEVLNGVITGNGTYTKVGLWSYVGGFLEGKFNGKGKKTYPNGEFIDGEWSKGILTSCTSTVSTLVPYKQEFDKNSGKIINLYGYKTKDGEIVIQPIYSAANVFSEGLASVKTNTNFKDYTKVWGYIDIHNNLKIDYKFSKAESFSDGLAVVSLYDKEKGLNKYFYIDKNGNQAFEGVFEYATNFSEGLAAVVENNKYGYINQKGKLIIPYQFEVAGRFKDGRAVVQNKSFKSAIIDEKGNLLTAFEYVNIDDFHEDMARVEKGSYADGTRRYGYINKAGKLIIPIIYEFGSDFENGKVKVTDENGRDFYIDKTGKEVSEED